MFIPADNKNLTINQNYPTDKQRLEICNELDPMKKITLGQFMTPDNIASFMASLFNYSKQITLLDAGAGIGSLSSAVIKNALNSKSDVQVDAWEIDKILHKNLNQTFDYWTNYSNRKLDYKIYSEDFIFHTTQLLQSHSGIRYTHAILNPPYKKINSNSKHRFALRKLGIETVNLYSAFVSLAIKLLLPKGELVAIIPRSFCNGPYYKQFREIIFSECAITHIHLFESRNKAFSDDDVLQENIIIKLVKHIEQNHVIISTSHDATFNDYEHHKFNYRDILKPDDKEKFIRIPSKRENEKINPQCNHTLKNLKLDVSTGPIVDFRMKKYLKKHISNDSIPLIYPHNFSGSQFQWPRIHKKAFALQYSEKFKKQLYPNGNYVLIKRFSSKEELKRVVAYFFNENQLDYEWIGFENHLNVIHSKKNGINRNLALGMFIYLNTSYVDKRFRIFSGHTQVNATDLRNFEYPSRNMLITLGKISKGLDLNQNTIDELFQKLVVK